MKQLAIVGVFFDGYIDLWRDFFGLMKNNWPDCPYDLYVIDNEIQLSDSDTFGLDVKVLNAGTNAEYSKKIQMAVECIDAEYLLLLLEDFFIVSPVNTQRIIDIMKLIENEKLDYYSMPMPEFVDNKEKESFKDYSLRKISKSREYIFSCQPSIWNKEFLKLCIGKENYNAWIFEGIYAKSECVRNEMFLKYSVLDYSNPLNIRHGAIQGKLVPNTVKLISKCGYIITTSREILPYKYVIKNQIKRFGHRVCMIPGFSIIRKVFKKDSVLERYSEEIKSISKKTIDSTVIDKYIRLKEANGYKNRKLNDENKKIN